MPQDNPDTLLKAEKVSASTIRKQNLALVSKILHQEQVASVSRLKVLTGLSVVTLTKLLNELVSLQVVKEGQMVNTGSGRPAKTYVFNAAHKLLLIVSCYQRSGHDYAGYSVHDLFGECLERREELLSTIHTDEFRIGIERYLERYDKIAMIGISMPNDTVGGRVASALRHDVQSRRLAKHLSAHFKADVFFETDINAAALGCYNRRSDYKFVSGVVLMPGRVPSCGFCYEGSVLRGRDGMAGEVRYFPMYNDVGILPSDPKQADELAVRTLRAIMCVLNPAYVVVYTEGLKGGLTERLKKRLLTPAEMAMLPVIELSSQIRDDIVSGMITLCLRHLAGSED